MTRDERKAWLESLAVGDVVIFDATYTHGVRPEDRALVARVVTKITAKYIVIAKRDGTGELRVRRDDGREARSGAWDFAGEIEPLTDEVRAHWRRRKTIARLRAQDWSVLPADVLFAVSALLPDAAKGKP